MRNYPSYYFYIRESFRFRIELLYVGQKNVQVAIENVDKAKPFGSHSAIAPITWTIGCH